MVGRLPHGFPLLVLLSVAAAGVAASAAGEPPSPCYVELTVDEPAIEAKVSSTEPGAATTSGTYEASLPPVSERAVLTIQGSVDTGWPISISPSTIIISGNVARSGRFDLAVLVPSGELPITGTVTLTARMVVGGIQCTPDTVYEPAVTVLPYVDEVGLSAPESLLEVVTPGTTRTTSVDLAAKTNGDITVLLEYGGPAEVTVTGPPLVVAHRNENGTAIATFDVRLAVSAEPGEYLVSIRATATAGQDDTSAGNITLVVRVLERQLPAPGVLETLLALTLVGASGAAGTRRSLRSGESDR